jgi:hypothetical protein
MTNETAGELTSRVFYPNPFIPAGIEFEISQEAEVSLVIFDGAGNEVKTLLEGRRFPAGVHQLSVDLPDAGGGKYLYRLTAAYVDPVTSGEGARKSLVEVKRI